MNINFKTLTGVELENYYRNIQQAKSLSVLGIVTSVALFAMALLSKEPKTYKLMTGIAGVIIFRDTYTMMCNEEKYVGNLLVRFAVNVGYTFGLKSRTDQLFKNTLLAKFLFDPFVQ